MPNTVNLSLPYPQASDSVDVPRDISALAVALDTKVAKVSLSSAPPASPVEGLLWYQTDTDLLVIYNGTSWTSIGGGNAAGNSGLVSIAPSGATGGTVSGSQVTVGSAVSTVTVSGVFSSLYENYKVIYAGGVGSTTQAIGLQLDGSATAYYGSAIAAGYNSATVSNNTISNAASWTFAGVSSVDNNYVALDILNPNLAKVTGLAGAYINPSTTGNGGTISGYHAGLTQFTGFKLIVTGTITGGTINVYGYRKGA